MPKGVYTRKTRNKKSETKRVAAIRKTWKKKLEDKNNTMLLGDSEELKILFLLTHSMNPKIVKFAKEELLLRALTQLKITYGAK